MVGNVPPEADAVRAEVEKIAAGSGFLKSERLRRFLCLIVEETLAGRGDNIKEYLIGTEVYGRPQDYDPRLDATVRVEASKLRKRLEAYYTNEGIRDPVVIRIPKGGYRPEFEHRSGGHAIVAVPIRSRQLPLIAVAVVLLITSGSAGLWFGRPSSQGLRAAHQRLISAFPGSHENASFSPDGAMIAFVSRGDNDSVSQIWIKATLEGAPIQITFGATDAVRPVWSPRGDQIVFEQRGHGIWSVPPSGGTVHRIIEDGRHASISPDGSHLLFVRRRELWIAGIDGASQHRLDGLPERFFPMQTPPAFSPDGRWIAFFNAEVGPLGDIWVIPANGGHPRRLTSDQAETRGLVWSRNGKWIIFSSTRAGSFTLWRVPVAGGGVPEPVTSGAGEDVAPTMSPDGKKLLYTNTRTSQSLMVLNPASGKQTELFAQRETIGFPSFSPDGKRIAFFQPVDGDPHLFLVGNDGGDRQQISRGSGREILPAWSNDGSSLFYYEVKPELSFRKLELFGGVSTKVADWAYGKENWARVDPLGNSAVYTVVGPKGPLSTRVRELTSGREVALPVTLTRSQWSPDGRYILGESGVRELGNSHVAICRAVENECREVSAGLAPKWSADGLRIYYLRPAARPGWLDLWSAARDGRRERMVTTLGPFRADEIHFDISRAGQIVWAPTHEARHELWLAELN
jgi:Tol biopolymer transport system component